MCHHESAGHPFPGLSIFRSSWGNHYQRILYLYLWSWLPKFYFSMLFSLYSLLFNLSLLSTGWVVIAPCGSISVIGYGCTAYTDYMELYTPCPRKTVKLDHSFTHICVTGPQWVEMNKTKLLTSPGWDTVRVFGIKTSRSPDNGHIYPSVKYAITDWRNSLSVVGRQVIIWINTCLLMIESLLTDFNESSIKIHSLSFRKKVLKMSSSKRRASCLGILASNVITVRLMA